MTVVGVDTHKDTLAACKVDDAGRALEHRSFANTPNGYAELASWISHDEVVVAMEGSGLYGRVAAAVLTDQGIKVVEVPPHMTAVARRRQRTGSKTDPGDALAIARVALSEPCLPPSRPHGQIEELRCLVRYRRELVTDRTRQTNRLHADLEQLRPGYHQQLGSFRSKTALDRAFRLLRGDTTSRAVIARDRIKTLRTLQRTIDNFTADIRDAVEAIPTALLEIDGIGHLTAAEILTEIGDATRFETKANLAMANGIAPVEASSGRVRRHRLNRGGNRQLNKAIHTAAIAQIAHHHTEGHHYYQRCVERGKTKREAIRALKRRISDRIGPTYTPPT